MDSRRFFPLSRDFAAALLMLLVALGGAFAWWRVPAGDADAAEAAAEFRAALPAEVKTIAAIIADSKAGKNVSEFRMGMFSMNLLNQLSDQDAALGAYFHKDGRTMQTYLTDVFQYHSEEEVARIAAMEKEGDKPVRQSAHYALEALRHIPEPKDPPADQEQDRKALIEALAALEASLNKAGKE